MIDTPARGIEKQAFYAEERGPARCLIAFKAGVGLNSGPSTAAAGFLSEPVTERRIAWWISSIPSAWGAILTRVDTPQGFQIFTLLVLSTKKPIIATPLQYHPMNNQGIDHHSSRPDRSHVGAWERSPTHGITGLSEVWLDPSLSRLKLVAYHREHE